MDIDKLPNYCTFKEIDQMLNAQKGTAFKAFKQLREALTEGVDYEYLALEKNAELIATLKATQRLYQSTVNAVLTSPDATAKIRNFVLSNTSK